MSKSGSSRQGQLSLNHGELPIIGGSVLRELIDKLSQREKYYLLIVVDKYRFSSLIYDCKPLVRVGKYFAHHDEIKNILISSNSL